MFDSYTPPIIDIEKESGDSIILSIEQIINESIENVPTLGYVAGIRFNRKKWFTYSQVREIHFH